MSITCYAGKQEGNAVSFVHTLDEIEDNPKASVNMSNRNADIVLSALGVTLENGFFEVGVEEFINRCTQFLRQSMTKGQQQKLDDVVHAEQGRVTIVDCGLPEGYVEQRVHQLVILAQEGKTLGANVVYGC
jgi:hypothetical protein